MIAISFFNQPYLVDKIEMGQKLAIFGKWDQKEVGCDWYESIGSS